MFVLDQSLNPCRLKRLWISLRKNILYPAFVPRRIAAAIR